MPAGKIGLQRRDLDVPQRKAASSKNPAGAGNGGVSRRGIKNMGEGLNSIVAWDRQWSRSRIRRDHQEIRKSTGNIVWRAISVIRVEWHRILVISGICWV